MHFQQALVQAMDAQQVSLLELAARTGSNPRWLTAITTNTEWKPKLDTILRLCYALRFNVLDFLALAEAGSRGQAPSSKLQAPSSKLQAPSSKLQAPSSKLQAPSSKLQAKEGDYKRILELEPRQISLALRHLRLERGFSQYKMERLTPFSVHTICMRESDHYSNYPTTTTLYSYCDAYGITLSELIACAFSFIPEQKNFFSVQ